MIRKIARSVLPYQVRQSLVPLFQRSATFMGRKKVQLSEEEPNAIIFLVPDYGNVGDLAIGYAQEQFLEKLGGLNVVSVSISETYQVLRFVRQNLKPGDLVFLVGGGSTGDLSPAAQRGREFIVNCLTKWPIISFPQSVVYSFKRGYEISAKREAKALANASQHLTLVAREKQSLETMQSFFPGEIGYVPDIVFSLVSRFQDKEKKSRSGVLLVLRKDDERGLSSDDWDILRKAALQVGQVQYRDHGIPDEEVDSQDPYSNAIELLEEYRSADLVITDRLHGMIFAAVTGTPCVVLPNKNHKVVASYHAWVESQCPYISLLPKVEKEALETEITKVMDVNSLNAFSDVAFDFADFERIIRSKLNRAE